MDNTYKYFPYSFEEELNKTPQDFSRYRNYIVNKFLDSKNKDIINSYGQIITIETSITNKDLV